MSPAFDTGLAELKLPTMAGLGDKTLDKRIIERNIQKGVVTKEDYERHLAALPDKEGSFERVEVEAEEQPEENPVE